MTKVDDFRMAAEKLRAYTKQNYDDRGNVTKKQDEQDAKIMSDTNNWCFVHITRYKPRFDKNGNFILTCHAMVDGGKTARNTVHGALNHIVENHGDDDWSDCPYVIFARYNDIVAKNGDPVGIDLIDTYFSVDVDTGLVLPKDSAYYIHPSSVDDTELYRIGQNEATYKAYDFTDEEIKTILSKVSAKEREKYDKYMSGDLEKWEIADALKSDKRIEQFYEQAKAKGPENEKAFLRGLMTDKRDSILSKFLRDFVTRAVMNKKGFEYVDKAQERSMENSLVADAIRDVAISKNIDTGFDAHARSVYGIDGLQKKFVEFGYSIEKVIHETSMDKLFDWLLNDVMYNGGAFYRAVVRNDFQNLDNYKENYEEYFQKFKEIHKDYFENNVSMLEKYGYMDREVQKCDTIDECDPKFSKALDRQILIMTKKLRDWRKKMEPNQRFQKLVKKLEDWESGRFEDIDTFMKPSIDVNIDGIKFAVSRLSGRGD